MWTEKEQDLLERFNLKFPAPKDDNNCRAWTYRLAEQFAYTFPYAGWGTKSAGGGRPQSTDVICTREPFTGYDVLLNQGKSDQTLASYPHAIDLSGQVYIRVQPVNHLAGVVTPTPPPTAALISRDEFYARFRAVNDYYAAPEGLKRPGGMVIDSASPVRCDVEAMGKWGYDLMLGKTVEQCKVEIRQSDEWKSKHPGETP